MPFGKSSEPEPTPEQISGPTFTIAQMGAFGAHEQYLNYRAAGFSRFEALELVKHIIGLGFHLEIEEERQKAAAQAAEEAERNE